MYYIITNIHIHIKKGKGRGLKKHALQKGPTFSERYKGEGGVNFLTKKSLNENSASFKMLRFFLFSPWSAAMCKYIGLLNIYYFFSIDKLLNHTNHIYMHISTYISIPCFSFLDFLFSPGK